MYNSSNINNSNILIIAILVLLPLYKLKVTITINFFFFFVYYVPFFTTILTCSVKTIRFKLGSCCERAHFLRQNHNVTL